MKRLTALILTVLTVCSALPMAVFGGRFLDVPDGKWYSEGISFCAANGYMDGVAEGKFDRQSNLTRAMFMTILANVDGADLSPYEGKSSFSDVKTDGWYTAAIEWAAQNEITGGIGDGADGKPIFGYKNAITREQMALLFYVYSEYVNAKNASDETEPEAAPHIIDLSPRADLTVYEDAERVHSWAREGVEWAVAADLISGTGENTLSPRGNCTRAEAAVMIRAYLLGLLSNCEHDWVDATCTECGYCNNCDLKSATELGHDFGKHLCTESVKCIRCDVMSDPTEHLLTEATCQTPSLCTICGYEAAPVTGHSMKPATCTAPSTCRYCGLTEGTAKGHSFKGATCVDKGMCVDCRQQQPPIGHTTSNGICNRCYKEVFISPHHKLVYYINTRGTFDGEIKYYYKTFSEALYDSLQYVYLVPGESEVYLMYSQYDTLNDITHEIIMVLPNSTSQEYVIYSYCYDDNGYYYYITGMVDTSVNEKGRFMLYSYEGSDSLAAVAIQNTNKLLPVFLINASDVMRELCYVDIEDYGFDYVDIKY